MDCNALAAYKIKPKSMPISASRQLINVSLSEEKIFPWVFGCIIKRLQAYNAYVLGLLLHFTLLRQSRISLYTDLLQLTLLAVA